MRRAAAYLIVVAVAGIAGGLQFAATSPDASMTLTISVVDAVVVALLACGLVELGYRIVRVRRSVVDVPNE